MSIAIVADSVCDLTPSEAGAAGIDLVPISVRFGDSEYRDGVDLHLADFYTKFETSKEPPSTSPPSEAAFYEVYARHVGAGKDVVALTVSSKLSGTYANALAAAASFGAKVSVFDTRTISGGFTLLARSAARAAQNAQDAASVIASLERWITTQHGYSIYPELKYLERSGRINKAQLVLGTLMRLVPIIRTDQDGTLQSETTARTFDAAKDLLLTIALRHIKDRAKVHIAVSHTRAPDQAKQLVTQLSEKLGGAPQEIIVHEAGPTIVANVGPGALSIFSYEE